MSSRGNPRAVLATLALVVTSCGFGFATPAALARGRIPQIASVRCWPPRACEGDPHLVAPGGELRLRGRHLKRGMLVFFPGSRQAKLRTKAAAPRLRRARGRLVVRVPSWAKSGRIAVALRHGPRSNSAGPIRIKRASTPLRTSGTEPFEGTGMWIWYVKRSSGGDTAAIAAQARIHGVRTVFVKSSDGTTWWPQFSSALVSALRAQGIQVCAWQFVYGSRPAGEAALGARAATTGAPCLVIDAESAYEGKYAQAQSYINALRAEVGPNYPVGLAGFPYVDYHRGFPYSVFLGPGGAQANMPQIYWRAIGTSVDNAVAHTYAWNELYQRPIFPLGQLYGDPPPSEIQRFRQLTAARGAAGVSWWSWQSASARGWTAIGSTVDPIAGPPAPPDYPTLQRGSRGDVVVWAQQHLVTAGQTVRVDGAYSAATEQAVRSFQAAQALLVTGRIDPSTWSALLRYQPAPPAWSRAARNSVAGPVRANGPRSASLRARRDELGGRTSP
jgi:hypothetical protein